MKSIVLQLLVLTTSCASAPRPESATPTSVVRPPAEVSCDPPSRPVVAAEQLPSGINMGPPEGEFYWDGGACVTIGAFRRVGNGDRGRLFTPARPLPVVPYADRESCEVAHAHCS